MTASVCFELAFCRVWEDLGAGVDYSTALNIREAFLGTGFLGIRFREYLYNSGKRKSDRWIDSVTPSPAICLAHALSHLLI